MTCADAIIHAIDIFELRNTPQTLFTKWRRILEGMQHNSFQQVSKRHIMIFSETFEYLDHTLLHTHANLHTLNWQVAVFDVRVFFVFIHRFPSRDADKGFFCMLSCYLDNLVTI